MAHAHRKGRAQQLLGITEERRHLVTVAAAARLPAPSQAATHLYVYAALTSEALSLKACPSPLRLLRPPPVPGPASPGSVARFFFLRTLWPMPPRIRGVSPSRSRASVRTCGGVGTAQCACTALGESRADNSDAQTTQMRAVLQITWQTPG